MLRAERLDKIVEITNQHHIITIENIMNELGVSKATVRWIYCF
ncbi:DeoR family transcriptional regulator [Petroclostridium sp. X23]|nr:DeoR family transcriptional regulator [Petroclostridium sp. X23]WHH57145.1 DeoR family transcriptional regulator [Petroclostridium sp. X23]